MMDGTILNLLVRAFDVLEDLEYDEGGEAYDAELKAWLDETDELLRSSVGRSARTLVDELNLARRGRQ